MTKNNIVRRNGRKTAKHNTVYGDWTLLGMMLRCSSEAAKKRYERGNKEAIEALELIIKNREDLIQSYQNQEK